MTTRRDVLRGITGLSMLGVLPAAACGGDDGGSVTDAGRDAATVRDGSTAADSGSTGCDSVSHETNIHSHSLTIPLADVTAGAEKSYTLGGGHMHGMTVTAAMFAMLADGEDVVLTSGGASAGSAHMHMVTLRCG